LAITSSAPLNVPQTRSLLTAGFQALEARKQEVNDLNVYPVPDGDTGTNLALTVRSVVDAVGKMQDGQSAQDIGSAISQAALMGARGNSGVILSQIIRGAMNVVGAADTITEATVVHMLREAADTAYRAVRRPVEGTILTVLREMAEAAERAPEGLGVKMLMDEVVAAGWKSVERTPTLLRVLADAGVVDAGGYGLVVLVEGAVKGSGDWDVPIAAHIPQSRTSTPPQSDLLDEDEEESDFTYCCTFLVTGVGLQLAALERDFGALGDSLLVVGGEGQFKVHVHSDEPGKVLGLATSLGVLTEIEIDNMKEQTAARTRRLQEAADGVGGAPEEGLATQIVAVVAGEGNKALYRSLGVDFLVEGGQSMNPSAEDLLRAIETAKAPTVIVLPNNGNVIMTAEQTIALTKRDVHVVPSRSIQAGLSAAVVYDRRADGRENLREMTEALERVITGEVTQAVREAQVDGVKVKEGDFIGLVDDRVIVSAATMDEVLQNLVSHLLGSGQEILTALLGEGETGQQARKVIETLRDRYPRVEIDIHEGGQPFYPVLLAAE
jgi:DAK2 domain fusion protein YloV